MNKIIIFLIRKKLGLKKHECFQFENQKSKDVYFFGTDVLLKFTKNCRGNEAVRSGVSLNWLLDNNCNIMKMRCPCNRYGGDNA